MTDSVLIGIIALIVFLTFGVAIAVVISRALSDAFRTINSMHKRSAEQLSETTNKLLNRLMAIKWEDFVSLEAYEDDQEGGFEAPPDAAGEVTQIIPEIPRRPEEVDDNEAQLLREDFA